MKLSNRTYDTIKLIALACVPILAFIASVCTIWNVPHAEQITATLTAFDTMLGALVVVLAKIYNKVVPSEHDNEIDAMGAGEEEAEKAVEDYEDGEDDE